jgi:hypothetical protein
VSYLLIGSEENLMLDRENQLKGGKPLAPLLFSPPCKSSHTQKCLTNLSIVMPTLTGMHTNRTTSFHEYPHASKKGREKKKLLPSPLFFLLHARARYDLHCTQHMYIQHKQTESEHWRHNLPSLFTDWKGTALPNSEPF